MWALLFCLDYEGRNEEAEQGELLRVSGGTLDTGSLVGFESGITTLAHAMHAIWASCM